MQTQNVGNIYQLLCDAEGNLYGAAMIYNMIADADQMAAELTEMANWEEVYQVINYWPNSSIYLIWANNQWSNSSTRPIAPTVE